MNDGVDAQETHWNGFGWVTDRKAPRDIQYLRTDTEQES
jgi:hypothetical protein